MPNLKDIRRRIRSVKNMQQITKAMKMVSAARLRRAQERVVAARPYASTMTHVLQDVAARVEDYSHPLLEARGDENYLFVLVTADKGLCGGFNTNLIRASVAFFRENTDKTIRRTPRMGHPLADDLRAQTPMNQWRTATRSYGSPARTVNDRPEVAIGPAIVVCRRRPPF